MNNAFPAGMCEYREFSVRCHGSPHSKPYWTALRVAMDKYNHEFMTPTGMVLSETYVEGCEFYDDWELRNTIDEYLVYAPDFLV